MSIGSALQKGMSVYVYNEKGSVLFTYPGELYGYTGSTVSILKRGGVVITLNEKGRQISSGFIR